MKHEIRVEKNLVRVVLEGEIDMHVAQELRSVLRSASDSKPACIAVDLGKVPFMDSSGIATIVEALKNARKWSGSLKVENCQEAVRDTLEIAGLTGILGVA